MSGRELADTTRKPDKLTMMSYLSQIYELFRREIPAAIGMGDNDPFSVTMIHGSKPRFSDDDVLDRQNGYGDGKQRYQKRGKNQKNQKVSWLRSKYFKMTFYLFILSQIYVYL